MSCACICLQVAAAAAGGLYDAYEGEPAGASRKALKAAPKAAAAAAASSSSSSAVAEEKPVAFQFKVPNDAVEGKTNPQIKAALQTAFFGQCKVITVVASGIVAVPRADYPVLLSSCLLLGWGVVDEIRLVTVEGEKGQST